MAVLQTKGPKARSPLSPNTVSLAGCQSLAGGRLRGHHALTAALLSLSAWGVMLALPSQSRQTAQAELQIALAPQPWAVHASASRPAAADSSDQGLLLAQTKSPGSSSLAREPSEPEAPSVLWLIAMPAIPLLGGAFIYVSRRLLGRQGVEARSLHKPSKESTSCSSMTPKPTELETDSLRD